MTARAKATAVRKAVLAAGWKRFSRPVEEGYRTPLYAATSHALHDVTGQYLADERVAQLHPKGLRVEPARRLFELSEQITGVRYTP